MKNSLIAKILFTFILALTNLSSTLYAQERNLKTELLVYILPDSLELPPSEKGLVPLDRLGKYATSKQLHSALVSSKASKIGRAFPQWATKDSVVIRSDGKVINAPAFHRVFIVSFDSEKLAENAITILSKLSSVRFAEAHAEPEYDNDPSYLNGSQWYLNNDGRLGGVVGADINAETAWGLFTGSSAVKIAIIDSGIDLNHTEFSGRISGEAHTGDHHGTLVAGVAAANAMNGAGMRGLDWNAQVISKKTSDNNGLWLGDNNVAQKITDAVAEGANVLNCSWSFANTLSTTLRMAFEHAYSMDRVVVATMGNTGTTQKRYPSGYRNVLAVGATQNNDVRSPFSTMGTHIDVVAPGGVNSDNTDARNIFTTTTGSGYTFTAGTSFAAPQVAGLASLLKGYKSSLTNDDIRQIIRLTADQVPDMNGETFTTRYGYGRINAGRALQFINDPNKVVQGVSYGGTTTKTNLSAWVYTGSNWNLVSGTYYNVDRYKVTKRVNFDVPFCSPPVVWMRERESACLSAANPNDGYPYVAISNVSETGFDVTYYTYFVRYNALGQTINKWVPATTSLSKIAYTAVGIPNEAGTSGSIMGESLICSSNSAYSLQNLPAGCTISWEKSSNLSYVSGQNTNNYVVKANGNGEGWVKATVYSDCGSVKLPQKTVWVGTPGQPYDISGFPYNGLQFPSNSYLNFIAWALPVEQGIFQYEWSVGGGTILNGQGSPQIEVLTGNATVHNPLYFDVSVRVCNDCGWSPWLWRSGTVIDNGGGGGSTYSIFPNPATTTLAVSISESVNSATQGTVEIQPISSIKVYDKMGQMVLNRNYPNKPRVVQLNISHLQKGIYLLKVNDVESHTLIKD